MHTPLTELRAFAHCEPPVPSPARSGDPPPSGSFVAFCGDAQPATTRTTTANAIFTAPLLQLARSVQNRQGKVIPPSAQVAVSRRGLTVSTRNALGRGA